MSNLIASFIIPAYNASKTIVRCLDSIYKLPLNENEYEVIVIDDCSVDNTVDVVVEYALGRTNITLLRQSENHRQGAARNRGVSMAKGKYIVFVDSDDESAKGVVEALQLAENHNLDMVAMHYVNVDEHGHITEKDPITLEGLFTGVELQTKQPYWCAGPVPYVYKTSFLQEVNYPFTEDVLFEDSDFVMLHLYKAKRMMYCSSLAYRAYYNATSTTHTTTYKHVADYVLLGTRMLNFYHSLADKTNRYALGICEGGSFNIYIACKRLFKLSSIAEVREFYNRVDSYINRTTLLGYTEPKYCWTWWTLLCMKHKNIAIILATLGQCWYKITECVKNYKK
jgi:glycosyltransferase involved in cell wall biosynthesis